MSRSSESPEIPVSRGVGPVGPDDLLELGDPPAGHPQRQGRPRDPAIEEAVLDTALRLMAEHGYAGMSIDAIARETGVGKPAIYRRFANKADIATAALSGFQMREPRVHGATARERVASHLRSFRTSLLRPNGMSMLGTILAEEHRTPELFQLFRERIIASRRRMLRALLEQAIADGEVRADADVDAAVNLLVGSFYARYLSGEPVSESWVERILAVVWPGIAASADADACKKRPRAPRGG